MSSSSAAIFLEENEKTNSTDSEIMVSPIKSGVTGYGKKNCQRDIITVEKFECGIFMTPLMMRVMAEGEYFEWDVPFPGLSC